MMRRSPVEPTHEHVRKEKPHGGRTNISVDDKVFAEFSAEADRQHKTLFAFASESLLAVSKISAEGGYPSDLYHIWRTMTILKAMDVITLPSDFIDDIVARQYAIDKSALLKEFRDLGTRLVGVLKIVAADLDDLEEVARDFAALMPIKEFRMRNLSDGSVEIAIVGAGRRIESTECSLEFIVSILTGYGYVIGEREVNVGTIRLLAARKGSV